MKKCIILESLLTNELQSSIDELSNQYQIINISYATNVVDGVLKYSACIFYDDEDLCEDTKKIIQEYLQTMKEDIKTELKEELMDLNEEKETEHFTATQFVQNVGVGWNLGNTLDATASTVLDSIIGTEQEASTYETLWGNPVTTKEMIDFVKESGFNAVRVPVTWSHHIMDEETMEISPIWMKRVEEIVGYVLDNDMYCILNTHHDCVNYGETNPTLSYGMAWLNCNPDTIEITGKRLFNIWTQIGTHFKDYSYKLIFEGFNEVMTTSRSWADPTDEEAAALNYLNQQFVTAVRQTGGKNSNRVLNIEPYKAGSNEACLKNLVIPEDSMKDGICVQVHQYTNKLGEDVEYLFDSIKTYLEDKDIPYLIGEFGCSDLLPVKDRGDCVKNFVARAKEHGGKIVWWDASEYQLLDRNGVEWIYPTVVSNMIEGLSSEPIQISYTVNLNLSDISYWVAGDTSYETGKLIAGNLIRFADYYKVSSNQKYILSVQTEDGIRIKNIAMYDEEKKFLNLVSYVGQSLKDLTFTVNDMVKYIVVTMYNPWGDRSLAEFQSLFTAKTTMITLKAYTNEAVHTNDQLDLGITYSIGEVNLNDIRLWKSGEYSKSNGLYTTNSTRICLQYLVQCKPAGIYTFTTGNSNYAFIVRELNEMKNFVRSDSTQLDGATIVTTDSTHYLAISLYNPLDATTTYSFYENAFANSEMDLSIETTDTTNMGRFIRTTLTVNDIQLYQRIDETGIVVDATIATRGCLKVPMDINAILTIYYRANGGNDKVALVQYDKNGGVISIHRDGLGKLELDKLATSLQIEWSSVDATSTLEVMYYVDETNVTYTTLSYIVPKDIQSKRAYFNTNVASDNKLNYELKCCLTNTKASGKFLGAGNTYLKQVGTAILCVYNGSSSNIGTTDGTNDLLIRQERNKIYINHALVKVFEEEIFDTKETVGIFNCSFGDISTYLKFYSLKMWDEKGILIRDYIPVKDQYDVIGLYDQVNQTFYPQEYVGHTITFGYEVLS